MSGLVALNAPWRTGKTVRLNTLGEAYETPIVDSRGNAIAVVRNAEHAPLMALAPELADTVRVLVDVLHRCDADAYPSDLPHCTDEEWDAALAQGRAMLARVA